MKYPIVLTIAGSDSVGGAGIQADIKAISATGSYAASAITAVTVQNTIGVQDVFPVPAEIISAQIKSVISDTGADAVKIGMLHNKEVISSVKKTLMEFNIRNIVLDPVMVSTSGHQLLENTAIESLANELIPISRVITPNLPEAEILSGETINSHTEFRRIARILSRRAGAINGNAVSVLMKAGHLQDEAVVDIFYNAEEDDFIELKSKRFNTPNTHGTGCTLSSAFASFLAQGFSLNDSARNAKEYLAQAIASGSGYSIGHGHGPVNHFWMLQKQK